MPDLAVDGLLPIALGVGGAVLGGLALALPRLRRSPLPAILLVFGPPLLAAVWWQHPSSRTEGQPTDGAPLADYRIGQIQIREVRTVKVVTDRGRHLRVGAPVQPVPLADLSGLENHNRTHELSRKVIVRTGLDPSHNCHGWVFTGGRFWIAGVVDDILTDNEYRLVSTPAVGDLAVYRGDAGNVVHSGIVRSAEGCILVESKWGPMGRFIHCPDDQPFGGACAFYRSARRGHLLRGLPPEEAQAVSNVAPR
jgi:hypothetical protein